MFGMEFWIGIILGGIISLAASVAANIYNAKILIFLERRKLISLDKRRSKAIKRDKLIRALYEGRTSEAYVIDDLSALRVASFCGSMTCLCWGVGFIFIFVSTKSDHLLHLPAAVMAFFCSSWVLG